MEATDPAALLDDETAANQLANLTEEELNAVTLAAAQTARVTPSAHSLARLQVLRRGLLLRNARTLLALCLDRLVDNALQQGQPDLAADAADTLWGVRELLGEPFKAHAAQLRLAVALGEAGKPDAAEATLHKALAFAQAQAPGGNLVPASAAAARTLLGLADLLSRQGRDAEALEWLHGAVEVAADEETLTAAQAALAAHQS